MNLTRNIALRGLICCLALPASQLRSYGQEEPPCQVRVVTSPERAAITFDGEHKGASPLYIRTAKPGAHILSATLQDYKNYRKTLKLAPGERTTVDIRLEPVLGLVLVHSDPSEADVQVGGVDRGQTPLLITDLPIGKYRLRFSKPGYISKEIELTIPSRVPQKLNAQLTSDFAALVLDSLPSGATVNLNGVERGKTPCSIDRVPTGDSTLEISSPGYHVYREKLKLSAGETQDLVATLKAIPSKMKVVSVPPGARIYVDNQFKGEAPVELTNLEPKSYRIRAEMTAYEMMLRTVTLVRGSDVVEEFRLQRNCGVFELTTQPAGVSVFIDAKKAGVTEAKPNQTDRVSELFVVDLLPVGTHEVTLTKKGFFVGELTIEVERDQTVAQHYALKRRFIPNYEIRTATEIYSGVFVEKDPKGNVKLELRPGIFKTVPRKEIRSGRPLREETPGTDGE